MTVLLKYLELNLPLSELIQFYIYISVVDNHLPDPSYRGCIQKFSDWVDNEIYAYNNKHSLGSNTKGHGDKTH
jgi:hypothetical protein